MEENVGKTLEDVDVSDEVLDNVPKAQANNIKTNQVGLYKTKKLLHSKGNDQ